MLRSMGPGAEPRDPVQPGAAGVPAPSPPEEPGVRWPVLATANSRRLLATRLTGQASDGLLQAALGTFVLFSGLVYFVFMAAWLNVFLIAGELRVITFVAGLLALTVAALNIKDYFWFKTGPSLSIPDAAKPGLFKRMREVVASGSMGPMLASTVLLAIVANSYELLCTAGFPMVYTRALTLADLESWQYYAWLAAYNVIYVLPLLAIVTVFTWTMGARKLSEAEGRLLKLISGFMMLGFGLLLLIAPNMLTNALASIFVLAAAVGASLVVARVAATRPA